MSKLSKNNKKLTNKNSSKSGERDRENSDASNSSNVSSLGAQIPTNTTSQGQITSGPSSPTSSRGKKFLSTKKRVKNKKGTHESFDGVASNLQENLKGLLRSDKDAKVNEVNPDLDLLMKTETAAAVQGFSSAAFQREKSTFVQNMVKNTAPIRYLLQATGRFPFQGRPNADGCVVYTSTLLRPEGLYFVISSIAVLYFLFMGSFNLVDVMLNLTFGDGKSRKEECQYERMFETTIIDRNIVGFAGLWTALCHTTLTSVNLFFKRHYMARYLSFWSVAAQTLHVDVSIGLRKYSLIVVVFYVVIVVVLALLSIARIAPTTTDMPSLFSILSFRLNFPCLLERKIVFNNPAYDKFSFTTMHVVLEVVSGICLLFIFIASKVLILYFLHFCRMLTKAFKSWNARFHAVINFPDKFSQSVEGRTTYDLLFKDHCTLLSLIEGTDRCFATIVESYLVLQLISIILETYFLYRTASSQNDQNMHLNYTSDIWDMAYQSPFFIRPNDVVPGIIIMLSNTMILIVILREAGKISAVAKEGLEVIRRKTMMGRKSNQELWFTLSMYFSYTSQTQLSLQGSGFFQFDNMFVVTVVAIIFSNLVTVIQFAPVMDPDYVGAMYNFRNEGKDELRQHIGIFLRDLEKLNDKHWISEQDDFNN